MQDRHLQEQQNRRSLYLRLLPRLWILPVAAAGGALLCFLIYTLVIVTVYGQRQYRESATYEVNFAQNEETGKAYDYYNAATWQGLLFTHPQIMDTIEAELPDGMTMEEAQADTKADLISDIRYLTVEVTTPDAADTAQLSRAIRDALEHFGAVAKEFDSIVFLSATEPTLVVVSDRSRNAALLGMVLGLLISWFAIYLHALMDDAVYVPEDAAKRYGLPVLGVLPAVLSASRRGSSAAVFPKMLRRQLPDNFTYALKGKSRVLLMSPAGAEDARRVLAELSDFLADTSAREGMAGKTGAGSRSAVSCGFVPTGPVDDPAYDTINRTCQDVILILHFGQEKGARTENLLAALTNQGYQVTGLLLADADSRFLQEYYR